MVGSVDKPADARHRNGQDRGHDQLHAQKIHRPRSGHLAAGLIFLALAATADPLRIATFNTELSRDGPGLLLRDIAGGRDPQVRAVLAVIDRAGADIIALQGIDWDHDGRAISALNGALADPYPHVFTRRPNRGVQTGSDLDRDGRTDGPGDAQGYAGFPGARGMAVLSRLPVSPQHSRDYSDFLWRDLPEPRLPRLPDGTPYFAEHEMDVLRLSSTGHWRVAVRFGDAGLLSLLTFHATAPVFDGPEDRNGQRNADEVLFWTDVIAGTFEEPLPEPYLVVGDFNLDPMDGDGVRGAFWDLIAGAGLVDPRPGSEGGRAAAVAQGGANAGHRGPPELDTADWRDAPGPGNLRVDYVLPGPGLKVLGSGVLWPPSDNPFAAVVEAASRHRLVWVDVMTDR